MITILKIKDQQKIRTFYESVKQIFIRLITLITEDKVTDLFGIADDFHHFFDSIQSKYALNANKRTNTQISLFQMNTSFVILFLHFYNQNVR